MANVFGRVAAAVAAATIGGLVLFATAPPSNLVDIPRVPAERVATPDQATTITPEVTPFYDVAGLPAGAPGALARAEPIAEAPAGVRAWRIIYHSTDLEGRDLPVSGVFIAPTAPPPPQGYPLVTFAHGTTGVGRACGMSQTPFTPNTPGWTGWVQHMRAMAERGWAVVATDYSGLGTPGPGSYLVGPLEGRGVLDAARAVRTTDPRIGSVPIDPARLAVHGKSQGGEAALSSLELAPGYAPELPIAGGVILAPGVLAPIPGLLDVVASNPTSTSQNMFVMLIAKSFAESYPDLVRIEDVLTDEGLARLPLLEQYCGDALAERLTDVPLSQLMRTPVDRNLVTAISLAMPGSRSTPYPMLMLQGLRDKTILPQFTHAEAMSMCALGDTLLYVRYPEDDHGSLNVQQREAPPNALEWIERRWDGVPAPSNCANQGDRSQVTP